MLNNVTLMGHFTHTPEVKRTQSGKAVVSASLACDRNFKREGEDRECDFINVVFWNNTAELVGRYFKKGSLIALDGRIQTRSYTDNDGNKRVAFEVVAENIYFCGKQATDGEQEKPKRRSQYAPPPSVAAEANSDFEIISNDDDLPF